VLGDGTLGVIMTGMGADGLEGSRAIKKAGGVMLAQDEGSSAVWGMPGRVVQAGLADETLPLYALANGLMNRVNRNGVQAGEGLVERQWEVMYGSL
jgi:two-component system chemotaxis response regulator CheB